MRRVPRLAALAALITAIPASAAVARAPDTDRLRAIGWNVAWGAHGDGAALTAGSEVRVRVAPSRRRPPSQRAVRVTLVRLGENGARDRTVASRRLRRGTFSMKLPRGDGARYLLTVRAGRRTLREQLGTVRTPVRRGRQDPGTGPVPRPRSPSAACSPSLSPEQSATIGFDRPTAAAGEIVTLIVANTGECSFGGGYGFAWERLVLGRWQPVDVSWVVPDVLHVVAPGSTFVERTTIQDAAAMPPGSYRAVKKWNWDPGSSPPGPELVQYTYIDIVTPEPPGPCGPPYRSAEATAVAASATVRAGDTLLVTVTNAGPGCLRGSGYAELRPPDGGGDPIPIPFADGVDLDRYVTFMAGDARTFELTVPDAAQMPPGRYTFSYTMYSPLGSDVVLGVPVETEFEVVAD